MSHKNYPLGDLPSVPHKLKANATTNAFPNKNHDTMNTLYNKCLEEIAEGKFPVRVWHKYTLFNCDDNVAEQILNKIKAKLIEAGYEVEIFSDEIYIDNPNNV